MVGLADHSDTNDPEHFLGKSHSAALWVSPASLSYPAGPGKFSVVSLKNITEFEQDTIHVFEQKKTNKQTKKLIIEG